ncbi:hypothetical protein ACVWZV_009165 [Bradyrhizobium sp. GM5.1]
MTQVMNAGAVALALPPKSDLPRKPPEDAMHVLMQQTATLFGHEETGAPRRSKMRIPARRIVSEHGDRRGVKRDQPRLAELALADGEHALVEIEVIAAQVERFGMAKPCHRDQPEQAMIGPAAQSVHWR